MNEVRKLIKGGNVNLNIKYDDGEAPIILAAKSGENHISVKTYLQFLYLRIIDPIRMRLSKCEKLKKCRCFVEYHKFSFFTIV